MKGKENPRNERDNQEIRVRGEERREREGRVGKWEREGPLYLWGFSDRDSREAKLNPKCWDGVLGG